MDMVQQTFDTQSPSPCIPVKVVQQYQNATTPAGEVKKMKSPWGKPQVLQ